MISIRNSLAELEKCHLEREHTLDCYIAAIRAVGQYAVPLDQQFIQTQGDHLVALAERVAQGTREVLEESRATLRGVLREQRDKAAEYLNSLRDELSNTARALEEILDSLSQSDGDHENRLRAAVGQLRQLALSPEGQAVSARLGNTATVIEQSVEEMRKQHNLTVSQFHVEIRMLHKRIDALEAAAALDQLTQLFNRREIEDRIREAPEQACVILARVYGIRLAEVQFNKEIGAELAAAFTKRLRNGLTPSAILGRWSQEEFAAVVPMPKAEATATAKWITEHLSGSYACMLNGKTVRPVLQINSAVLEVSGNSADRLIEKVKAFLSGQ